MRDLQLRYVDEQQGNVMHLCNYILKMTTIVLESVPVDSAPYSELLPRHYSDFSDALGSVKFSSASDNIITSSIIGRSIDVGDTDPTSK